MRARAWVTFAQQHGDGCFNRLVRRGSVVEKFFRSAGTIWGRGDRANGDSHAGEDGLGMSFDGQASRHSQDRQRYALRPHDARKRRRFAFARRNEAQRRDHFTRRVNQRLGRSEVQVF